MLHQYHAPRFRIITVGGAEKRRRVPAGTIPAGSVLYLSAVPGQRAPWRVLGWLNRIVAAAHVGTLPGGGRRHYDAIMAGGHLALVQSLGSHEVRLIADHVLLHAADDGREHTLPPARGSFKALTQAERRMPSAVPSS